MSNIWVLKDRLKRWEKQENQAKEKYADYEELFSVIPNYQKLGCIENGSSLSFENIKKRAFDLTARKETIEKNLPKEHFMKEEQKGTDVIFTQWFSEKFPPIHKRTFNANVFQKTSEFFKEKNITLNYLEKKETSKGKYRSEGTVYYVHLDYLGEPYLFDIQRYESNSDRERGDWLMHLIATNETDIEKRSYVFSQLKNWFKQHSPERLKNVLNKRKIEIDHLSFAYINEELKKYVNTTRGGVPIIGSTRLKEQGYETVYDLLQLTIEELDALDMTQYRFVQAYFWVKEAGLSFKNDIMHE